MLKGVLKKIFFAVFVFSLFFNTILTISYTSVYAQDIVTLPDGSISPGAAAPGQTEQDAIVDRKKSECAAQGKIFDGNKCANRVSGYACLPIPFYFSLADCLTSTLNLVIGTIFQGINALLYWVVWAASLAFDATVYYTIVKFKTNFADMQMGGMGNIIFGNNGGQGLIYYLWGIIRDILNIIIFITIIYHAVTSMFEGFTETRRKFISLLVFSIVVNFSLLFVKLAIDVSNIIALQAYTLAVKPPGTETFAQFRDFRNTSRVTSYGEYLMNSVDLERLEKASDAPAKVKEDLKNIKGSFVYQIGRTIVYLGLAYLLLYLAGLLMIRASVFVISMIASPLLAFDVFFAIFEKSGGSVIKNFASSIRTSVTDKFKKDFYDALIKGPLFIFAIFLIGVLAESIFSQGLYDSLVTSLNQMPESTEVPSSFMNAIFVFFKFAVFFALCKVIIDKLNSMSFGTRLNTAGSAFANFVLGRGLGIVGSVGRNTVGRGINNSGIQQTLARWNANATQRINNNTGGVIGKQINRGIQNFTNRAQKRTANLITSSYDLRNSKLATALGSKVANATGISSVGIGKANQDGYEARDAAKLKARKDEEQARTDITKENLKASEKEIMDSKSKFEGLEMTLDEMTKVLKASESANKNDLATDLESTGSFTLAGKSFTSADQLNKIFDKTEPGSLDEVLAKSKEANEKKISNEKKKQFEKARLAQVATGNARTLKDSMNVFDRVSSNTIGTIEEEAQEKQVKDARDKKREDAIKTVRINNQILKIPAMKLASTNLIRQIREAVTLDETSTEPALKLSAEQRFNLEKSLRTLSDFDSFAPNKDNIPKFNKETLSGIESSSASAINALTAYYSQIEQKNKENNTNGAPEVLPSAQLNSKKTALSGSKRNINNLTKEYTKLTPKEERPENPDNKGTKDPAKKTS